ncbi:sigma-70 family RNA polymerase sigma factor [Herbaspirillum sp. alder98]|uniref:sigma-70 family RNA polymerase sigma factor n=1 Tax=Herbaspirillum sp. alder98 TaxID=2913096 RepID=UPI001CD91480|nr:sigma-70 family RNA polymerase sigma factor [Herbaspirillum sp. alder98]MCA1324911.1 sigma-70 family RNA polymerase sigma factor [Herbaspirillum sp. alder98]
MQAGNSPHHQQIEDLYADHHSWLQRWLHGKLGDAFDAADIAQDTFVRVLAAPDSTPEKQRDWALTEPRAYLTLVAKRLMANLYRRRTLEKAYLDALALMPQAQAMSPEQQRIILETLQEIDALLDNLPSQVRAAFLLAQVDGLGYLEIAQRLALSERTVKRYMVQAMAHCIVVLP